MIKSERNAIAKLFEPLTEPMQNQVSFDFAIDRVKILKKELERLTENKKLPLDVKEAQMDITRAELAGYEDTVKGLAGAVEKFHKDYNVIAEQAAKQFSQARVYYALDDTAAFNKYPFMRNIPLSKEEKEIVGIMREQMLHYKARIDELKVPTISGPYVAHMLHPKFKIREALNQFGGESARAAYMKFYRRSKNSRPLLPDIEDTMRSYVSDTERRIQQQTFAKEWEPVKKRVQGMPVLHEAFEELERGVNPVADTTGNRLANFYSSFEVFKRLFLNPSAGLKHLIKAAGDVSTAGFESATASAPLALDMTFKRILFANPIIRNKLNKVGIKLGDQDKLLNSFFNSVVPAKRLRERVIDWGLDSTDDNFHGIRAVWQNVQNVGSAWINLAELFDRGLSISTGLNIAAKKGMTIEQALYGTYDLILKNNFLSREFNPAWLRNPKIKAAFLFQGTPYKIFERRVVNAVRSGKVIKDLGKKVWESTKTEEGRRLLLKDLRDMRTYIKEGEHQLKSNLVIDTLRQDVDFYGTPIVSQFMKDILITGAATYGGAAAGMNLLHHFFHLPFLSTRAKEPVLAISPGLQAIIRGKDAWLQREEGDDEFLFTKIMHKWLGTGWYAALPDTVKKAHRLSENDIPEIYQDSKFRYLFAIPGSHK